jgi:membrane-associated phospholipid phosphatase
MFEGLAALDEATLRAIYALPRPGWLTLLMIGASAVGVGGAVWLAVGLILTLLREITIRDLGRLALAIALVHLTVDVVLKPSIDRLRPPARLTDLAIAVDVPDTRSFPSGHAANALAAALVLTAVWPRARAVVWAAAVIVATARVYLGIHYPLDALAGSLTGLACGWAVLRLPIGRWPKRSMRGEPED